MPLLSLNIFFGDNTLMGSDNSRLNNFVVLSVMELTLFFIVQTCSYMLRLKFERTLRLRKFALKNLSGNPFTTAR